MARPNPAFCLEIEASADVLVRIPALRRELSGRAAIVEHGCNGARARFDVEATSERHLAEARQLIEQRFGDLLFTCVDRVLELHRGGQVRVRPSRGPAELDELERFSAAGVQRVSDLILEDVGRADELTARARTIALVSDGTAFSRTGEFRPLVALPSLERRAVLLEQRVGLSAVPLLSDLRCVDSLVEAVDHMSSGFAAVCIADIAAPRCIAVQERLAARLDIPVVDDSQEPAAIVVLAALHNALRVVGKGLASASVVVRGAGPAAAATVRLLDAAGAADQTSPGSDASGTQQHQVPPVHGADALITTGRDVDLDRVIDEMDRDPIVFLLDDHVEQTVIAALSKRVAVLATRSPDEANWLDWSLAYPGVLRGLLDQHARELTTEMQLNAARLLAHAVGALLSHKNLLPRADDPDVVAGICSAIRIGSCTRQSAGVTQ